MSSLAGNGLKLLSSLDVAAASDERVGIKTDTRRIKHIKKLSTDLLLRLTF